MKRIVSTVLIGFFMVSLIACDFNPALMLVTQKEYSEVDEMALMEFLKDHISLENTVDEIIDVFEEMCKTPIEEDLLLLEYGVYDFTGKQLFYFDLVRQYPDGEGEYYQLRVSLMYSPDKENKKLRDTLWSDVAGENFFDYIRRSSGYRYAKDNQIKAIDIRIDQT